MALGHPLLGVGPDNFLYAYRSQYILPAAWQEPNLNHPHNWVLDWWTRSGIPGLLLALGLFGGILVRLGRRLGEVNTGRWGVLGLGLLAATVGALTHGLIDASFALPDLMMVWVLIAVFAEGQNESAMEISGLTCAATAAPARSPQPMSRYSSHPPIHDG